MPPKNGCQALVKGSACSEFYYVGAAIGRPSTGDPELWGDGRLIIAPKRPIGENRMINRGLGALTCLRRSEYYDLYIWRISCISIFGALSSLQGFGRQTVKAVEQIKGDSSENSAKSPVIFGFPGRDFWKPSKNLIDITQRITFFYKELFTFSTEFSTGLEPLSLN